MAYKTNDIKKLNQHSAILYASRPGGYVDQYEFDASLVEMVAAYRWRSRIRANDTFEAAAYQEIDKDGRQTNITLHRLVIGAQPGQQVAFMDGNTKNCHLDNLRVYDGLGERLTDFHTCQVPLRSRNSNVKSYPVDGGERFMAFYTYKSNVARQAGFETILEAQEWVLSAKASRCGCLEAD